jgi:hypothetical protein
VAHLQIGTFRKEATDLSGYDDCTDAIWQLSRLLNGVFAHRRIEFSLSYRTPPTLMHGGATRMTTSSTLARIALTSVLFREDNALLQSEHCN